MEDNIDPQIPGDIRKKESRFMPSKHLIIVIVSLGIFFGCSEKVGETPPSQSSNSANQEEHDTFKQDCMKSAGFIYIPFEPIFDTKNDGLPDTQEEEVSRWGFQISTNIEARFSGKGYAPARLIEEDPNLAITQKFSTQEQAAYQQAMIECSDKETKTLGHLPGTGPISEEDQRQEQELLSKVEKDTRVVKANKDWAVCMNKAGFKGPNRSQLISEIENRAKPFIEKYTAAVDTEFQKYRETNGDDYPGSDLLVADVFTSDELINLTNLQNFEMNAATADLSCSKKLHEVMSMVHEEKLEQLQNK